MFSSRYRKGYARSLAEGMRYGVKYAPVAKYLYNRYAGAPVKQRRSYQTVTRRPYRKYKKKTKTRRYQKPIRKEIRELKQKVNSNLSTYIKKARTVAQLTVANVGETAYLNTGINSLSVLDGVIDAVKYFDPATPGSLITVNLTLPTFQNQVRFVKSYSKTTCRNNYLVPCDIRIYYLENKLDTSISASSSMSNSLADMSNGSITSQLIFPSDCHDFNDIWSIKTSKHVILAPGAEVSLSWSCKPFLYDTSLNDSHASAYQKSNHGSEVLVRISGVMSHGSTSGVTIGKGGVDVSVERHHTVEYPGGSDIKYLEVADGLQTTAGTVQVSQLIASQQTYTL